MAESVKQASSSQDFKDALRTGAHVEVTSDNHSIRTKLVTTEAGRTCGKCVGLVPL